MHDATSSGSGLLRAVALAVITGGLLGLSALLSPLLPVVLAVLGIGVAALISLPLRPIAFLYGLVIVIPFSAALPRGAVLPFLVPSELLLVVTFAFAGLHAAIARRDNLIPGHLLLGAGVFVVGTSLVPIASYAFRGVVLEVGDLMALLAPLQYLILFWIFAHVPRSGAERRAVVQTMIAAGSAVAAIGILQALDVAPVVDRLMAWYPTHQAEVSSEVGRVTSVFGAWNALGLFLVTILLLISALYPDEPRPGFRRNMQLATFLSVVCLLATNLWSGIIGAVVGFAFIKWRDPRGLRAAGPLALTVALGIALLLPELVQRFAYQGRTGSWLPETLTFRWDVWWDVYLPRISESPWWGVRPSFAGLAWPHPESQYIGYLYRSGAVSLLAHVVWLALTAAWLVRTLRGRAPGGPGRGLLLTALSMVLVLSLVGIINPVFTYTGTMDYFWIILGLIVNEGRLEAHADT